MVLLTKRGHIFLSMMTVVAYIAGHIRVDVTLNVESKWERSGFAPHWERICLYIGRSSGSFFPCVKRGVLLFTAE